MPHERLKPAFTFDEERLKQLQLIVPEAFADGQINWETLKEALGEHLEDDGPDAEHFGLFWPGKRQARKMASVPSKGTLVPVYGEGLKADGTPDSDGHNDSRNIFIEGENLEVLKILQKSYASRIKMIYIDPPYNTGNDFVYEDDFKEPLQEYLRRTGQVDEEGKPLTTNTRADGRFHSKWLSMMYTRIRLARNLLKDDGVILIHIDESEVNSLSIILNEIFGEENDLGTIIWDKKNPKGDAKGIAYQHESILCFIKNRETLSEKTAIQRPKKNAEKILKKAEEIFNKINKILLPSDIKELMDKYKLNPKDFDSFKVKYDLEKINKEFSEWIRNQDFSGGETAYSKIDENGDVFQTVSMAWPNKKKAPDEYFIPLVHPNTKKECPIPSRGWRFPQTTMNELLENNEIVFGEDENVQPRRKYLLKNNLNENIPSIIPFGGSDDDLFSKWKIPFDNPKPYKFVAELIKYFTKEGDIILDFFAGSGTVGHSIFELSVIDKERHFVLVQLDEIIEEKTIAYKMGFRKITEITQKRLLSASKHYFENYSKTMHFKKMKLISSHYKDWQNFQGTDLKQLEMQFGEFASPLVENWKEENLLSEIILMEGFPLDSTIEEMKTIKTNKIKQVTSGFHEHRLLICLDKKIAYATIQSLKLSGDDVFICLDSAITDQDKVQLADKGMIKTI